jgi:GT2 family glycosyltransferase
LFDESFYLQSYKDIARKNSDPLSHFLLYGAAEGRWPNKYFDSALFNRKYQSGFLDINPLFFYLLSDNELFDELSSEFDVKLYLAVNKDVKDSGIDPLVHFLTDGKNEGRISHVRQFSSNPDTSDSNTIKFIPPLSKLKTTVILPVFNAYDEVQSCLNSLLKYTDLAANGVLVLDDASTDPRMKDLLSSYRDVPGITIRFNKENIGYTRNINQGVELSEGDIVLLNSDTEVGPHWLRNMKIAAYINSEIGTVTAVSNNAGAFSVPNSGTNELPLGFTTEKMARLVSRSGCNQLIEVPTGNGFCLYIKREVLESVGHFDEQLFPRGYGEENEFCMRVLRSGKVNVVSPNTYVYHVRSASFKEEKTELITAGVNKVKELYPDYSSLIKGIGSSELFSVSRQTIAERINTYPPSQPLLLPRIMFVISTRTGGTPQTNLDLMRGVSSFYDCYVMARS